MASITTAGTESLLEKQKLQGNGSTDAHTEEPTTVNNEDALNGDEGEESDEYDVEEEQQIVGDEDDEYELDEEDGGYEDEDEEHETEQNGKPSLTALLLGDPNLTVGNGNDDDDDDEEGDYEEDDDEDGDAEEQPEPISPSTAKKRSIDDLEEADTNEAKKVKA